MAQATITHHHMAGETVQRHQDTYGWLQRVDREVFYAVGFHVYGKTRKELKLCDVTAMSLIPVTSQTAYDVEILVELDKEAWERLKYDDRCNEVAREIGCEVGSIVKNGYPERRFFVWVTGGGLEGFYDSDPESKEDDEPAIPNPIADRVGDNLKGGRKEFIPDPHGPVFPPVSSPVSRSIPHGQVDQRNRENDIPFGV